MLMNIIVTLMYPCQNPAMPNTLCAGLEHRRPEKVVVPIKLRNQKGCTDMPEPTIVQVALHKNLGSLH